MNELVVAEHARRLPAYQAKADIHQFMERMNAALEPTEQYVPNGIKRPNLFIFGLPRSGTTLLYQLAARCLDVGYINNVAARFWRAPLTGVAFAESLLGGRRDNSYVSNYGKSVDISGPHEFSYFWQRWLKIEGISAACAFGGRDSHIEWDQLATVIACLQDKFGAGMVHKTNYAANFISGFATQLPMPIFIYVERDCIDVALSILSARQKYYGDLETWWATFPPSYEEIKGLPFAQQIARQVRDLRDVYTEAMASVPAELVVRLSYSELCANPRTALTLVRDRVAARYGTVIDMFPEVPENFIFRTREMALRPEERAVIAELKALGLAN